MAKNPEKRQALAALEEAIIRAKQLAGSEHPETYRILASALAVAEREGRSRRSYCAEHPPPDFVIAPVREGEISSANYETARKLAQSALPYLRELKRLNWRITLVTP